MAARRPMARATRIALFEREVRERLSRAALELVLARAEVISEGQRGVRSGRDAYFGSTMLTIDLPSLDCCCATRATPARRAGWPSCWRPTRTAGTRIQALAEREAARVAGAAPKSVSTHVAIRAQAAKVFIDVDVEAVFCLGADVTEEATYTFAGAAKILDIAESKLRYWAQVGFVGPSVRRGGKPLFTFQDLVSVKAAKELVDRGFKAAEIRKAIEGGARVAAARRPPAGPHPRGVRRHALVVVDEGSAYESTGQKVFDFGLGELAGKVG